MFRNVWFIFFNFNTFYQEYFCFSYPILFEGWPNFNLLQLKWWFKFLFQIKIIKNELLNCFSCLRGCIGHSCTQWKSLQWKWEFWIFTIDNWTANLHCLCRQGWHLHHCQSQELPHNQRRTCLCQGNPSPGYLFCLKIIYLNFIV